MVTRTSDNTHQHVKLAIVIVSWNVRDMLDACLTSLRQTMDTAGIEASVWVVDNASTDGSPALVCQRYPWVRLLAQTSNLGYVRANNLVMRQLSDATEYIWLLNPDTLVNADALVALLAFLKSHPRAGLIGPKLLNADGSLQESAFRFPGLTQALYALNLMPRRFYYTGLNGRYPPALYAGTEPFPIDHPLGAAMIARAAAVQDVGLLDEGFFMYCEEIDWAWRMKKAGWERWLVPTAEITHYGGASSDQARPEATAYLWESRAYLYRKHQGPLTRAIVSAATRIIFSHRRQRAPSAAWTQAYARILRAWAPRL